MKDNSSLGALESVYMPSYACINLMRINHFVYWSCLDLINTT